MLFVGILLPVLGAWWLLGRVHADLALSLIGLTSLPALVWAGSLGAKIGPCKVGDCMSSTQHSHLVIAIVAFVLVLVSFVLLSMSRQLLAGAVLIVSQLVGAYSMLKTDTAAAVMLLVFAALAAVYVAYRLAAQRDETRVPDFPPAV
jgi:hypothetical protein